MKGDSQNEIFETYYKQLSNCAVDTTWNLKRNFSLTVVYVYFF